MTAPASGPFASEDEAVTAARAVVPLEAGRAILSPLQRELLLHLALEAAGVATTPYEEQTLWWLCQWGDHTVAIIAGWVARAAAGKPGSVTFDLAGEHDYFALVTALGDFAERQRHQAGQPGEEHRAGWAEAGERLRAIAEGGPQAPAAEEGDQ